MSGWSVVVATDGSPEARAAVSAALAFPWPPGTRVAGVVARRTLAMRGRPGYFVAALDRAYRQVAAGAQRTLAKRWRDAVVEVMDETPADAIVHAAARQRARAIVMGVRARGRLPRLLLGSVARQVVRRAPAAVLVVRGRPREFTRFVIGVDGSPGSRSAVRALAGLDARRGRVTVVAAVEPASVPGLLLVPASVRGAIVRQAGIERRRRLAEAARHVATAEGILRRAGWTVRTTVREGRPLDVLLAATVDVAAHALVVGTRGAGGIERLLLGSVAGGALTHSPVSVLVVR